MRFGRPDNWQERLPTVLHTLYLIFDEGCTATSGASLQRRDLAGEAIRLTREVHRLLALMLLTDARREARTGIGRTPRGAICWSGPANRKPSAPPMSRPPHRP